MRLNPLKDAPDDVIDGDNSAHIASFVVQADAARMDTVCAAMCAIEGVEIHATDPCGKIVLTAESNSQGGVISALDRIRECSGVFSANLVYHQVEDLDAMEQEISL